MEVEEGVSLHGGAGHPLVALEEWGIHWWLWRSGGAHTYIHIPILICTMDEACMLFLPNGDV